MITRSTGGPFLSISCARLAGYLARSALRLGEVVDRGAADRRRGEVLLNPRADLLGVAVAAASHHAAAHAAAEEVVDLSVRDVFLELRERGRRVVAVESADGHHRLACRELVAGGV